MFPEAITEPTQAINSVTTCSVGGKVNRGAPYVHSMTSVSHSRTGALGDVSEGRNLKSPV